MSSIKFSLTKVAVATTAFLSGCGGGGGGSTDQQLITGKVADGYINGAIVFWDCDGNYALGKNEIWMKSGTNGAYSIPAAPAESCVLTANVPIGAIDEDNPSSPVNKSYTLLSVKGQESFISPLSTLVAAHVIGNPETKISDAEKLVANFLGVQGSIYSNYIENGGDDAIKMRGSAKIATAVLQKNNSPSNSMNGIQNAYLEVKNIAPSLPAINLGNSVDLNKFIAGLNSGVGSFESFNFKKSTNDVYDVRPNKNLILTEGQLNILDAFIKKANDRGAVRSGVIRFSEMTKNDLTDLLAELRKERLVKSSDDPLVRNLIDIENQKLKNIDDYYKEKMSGVNNFFGSDVATNIFFVVDVGINMLGVTEGVIKSYTNVPIPKIDLRKFRKQPVIKFYKNIEKSGEIGSTIVNIAKSLSAANKFAPTLLKSVETAAARSDESTFSAEEFTALMKLAESIAKLVEDSIKSKNAAPLFSLASSLNGLLVEGHCSAKYEWTDCTADMLEILGLFVEKMNLGARLEGAVSVMSSYLDAHIVGRDYAKETNKGVSIAILDVDTAWQDQINIIRKSSLINQITVSGVENLFEAYNASESCAANEFRSHGVCVSNQKNCGSLSTLVIPVQLAPPYVANPGLTYGFSTTPSPKAGYPYGSYLWKTSELSTPLIGASAQQNFVFNTVGSATVSVTPILTDGTVCTTSAMTTQVTVESALVRTVASVLPSSAAIGAATTFTITGQNIPLTSTMTLGGIPCQIQSNPAPTATGFTAVCTPSGTAGNQVVKIMDSSGTLIDGSRSIAVSDSAKVLAYNDFSSTADLAGWEFTLPWNANKLTTDYELTNGALRLWMKTTDKGGNALSPSFPATTKVKLSVRHLMNGGRWYFPNIGLTNETAVPTNTDLNSINSLYLSFTRSEYSSDNRCSSYDIPQAFIPGECLPLTLATTKKSSSFYGQWIVSTMVYDSTTGAVEIDLEGDGVVDITGTVPPGKRFTPSRVSFGTAGWWTGHEHLIDWVKVESMVAGDAVPAPVFSVRFDQASLTSLGGVTSSGGVSYISGKDGRPAAKFGGVVSPGHIKINNRDALKFADGATFDMWVYMDSLTGMDGWGNTVKDGAYKMALVAKSHDRSGGVVLANSLTNPDSNLFHAGIGNWNLCNHISSAPVPLGTWARVTYVFSSTSGTYGYLNKSLVWNCPSDRPDFAIMNTQDMYIGKFSDSWYPFSGAIQDLNVYSKALSSTQVSALQ